MDRDDIAHLEELCCIGRFPRGHHEAVANRQERKVGLIDLPDQLHVAEYSRVSGVIDLEAVLKLQDVAGSFAAIDDLVTVLDAAGMVGVHHRDLDTSDCVRTALIDWLSVLNAFGTKPQGRFKDRMHVSARRLCHVDTVADVIVMPMCHQDSIQRTDVFQRLGAARVVLDPGINYQFLSTRRHDMDCRVSQICQSKIGRRCLSHK